MKKVYIVAEVSQNHNGDINIAKELIEMAAMTRCDAVKFNKRHMPDELTKEAYDRPYDSENAFAPTYGEHREFLEFSQQQHIFLKNYANNRGLDYLLSVCDTQSLILAVEIFGLKFIKIPSKELTNLPLLEKLTTYPNIQVAFSIGMVNALELATALKILDRCLRPPIMVICTSEYPCDLDNVNLNRIYSYKDYKKGFSSHVPDPTLGIAAVAMGAEYIEYHITLDREMKGSDQCVALEFEELGFLVDSIRNLQIALGDMATPTETPEYLIPARTKLLKEICEDGIYRIK